MMILALDLSKFNTMCCFFDTETRKHTFLNAATDRNYLTTVFKKHKIDLVVMEACGPSSTERHSTTVSTKPNAPSVLGSSTMVSRSRWARKLGTQAVSTLTHFVNR